MDSLPSLLSVSVVIPTFGRPALLRRCLDALLDQRYPGDRLEIIVVEDGGPGPARRVVADLSSRARPVAESETGSRTPITRGPTPTLRYTSVPRGGPAAARNAGWRLARGTVIAFTDDDTVPDPRWIVEGVRSIDGGAAAVSGRTIVPTPARPTDAQRNVKGLERATFATCNAFCRRLTLERVGGFDPRFTRAYREDSDLEFALLDAGARIVRNQAALVYHPPRPEPPFVSLRHQRNQYFDALLYRKHPQHFRRTIRARPPWRYYLIAACQLATVAGLLGGSLRPTVYCLLVWVPLVGRFWVERLRGAALTPSHVAEMLVTSVLIPPVAVYWRLRGAWTFRVPFL